MSQVSLKPATAAVDMPESAPDRVAVARAAPRWVSSAIWAFIVLGAGMQIWHFAGARPLWLDEAMVALNLRYLSPAELLGRLEYDQVAPLAWLQLEKLLLGLPIAPEYSLRLPSLAAGIGLLFVVRDLALRTLGGLGALSMVIFASVSIVIVRYAAEAKPYEIDVLACAVVLWLGVTLLPHRDLRPAGLAALGLAGLASIPFSFPVVFFLAGVGGVLFVRRVLEGRRVEAAILAGIGLAWVALFVFLMVQYYNPAAAQDYLRSGGADSFFRRAAYAPIPPTSVSDLVWYPKWLKTVIRFMFTEEARFPTAMAMAGGALVLARRTPWLAALVIAPLMVGLAASALHAYPLHDRLNMFMLPSLILMGAVGVGWIAEKSRPSIAPWALLTFLCVSGALPDLQGNLRSKPPFNIQDVGPVMRTLQKEVGPNDLIYVSNQAIPAYLFYRDAYGLSKTPWVAGKEFSQQWTCLLPEIPDLGAARRVWALILIVSEPDPPFTEAFGPAMALRNLNGRLELRASGQNVWLYSLTASPRSAKGAVSTPLPSYCGRERPNSFDPPARFLSRMN